MTTRGISFAPISFGSKYEPLKIRQLMDHVNRLTQELQRIASALGGGVAGEVLTKESAGDYDATWGAGGGGGGSISDGPFLVSVAFPDAPSAEVFVADGNYFTTTSGSGLFGITLKDWGVPFSKMQKIAPYSVLGNTSEDVAQIEEIQAGSDGQVLARVSGALQFVTLPTIAAAGDPVQPSVDLAGSPGIAITYMRSDAKFAIDPSISPTWQGQHTFAGRVILQFELYDSAASPGAVNDVLKSQGVGLPPIWGTVPTPSVNYLQPMSNGDETTPEVVFFDGDIVFTPAACF